MHFSKVFSSALLLMTAIASPIDPLPKRQIGGLASILQLMKGILPDTGAANGATGSLPGAGGLPGTTTVPSTSGSPAAPDTSCNDAIAKINDALTLSASLMESRGGQPTMQDVVAVLKVLEKSLGDECADNVDRMDKRDVQMQQEESTAAGTSAKTCSSCERALYKIVKELEVIFSLGTAAGTTVPSPKASGDKATDSMSMTSSQMYRRLIAAAMA